MIVFLNLIESKRFLEYFENDVPKINKYYKKIIELSYKIEIFGFYLFGGFL